MEGEDEVMREITYGDYLKIVGLLALAQEHNRQLEHIVAAIAGVVHETPIRRPGQLPYYGSVSDAVYQDMSADELLEALQIAMREDKDHE